MKYCIFFCFFIRALWGSSVSVGLDVFFDEGHDLQLKGKKIGLITNHTGVNREFKSTVQMMQEAPHLQLKALFAPEHGITGAAYANSTVSGETIGSLPVYSLYGSTRRPTREMLNVIDVLVFDIQDNGCRAYTYATTLFYVMEEAAKYDKEVIVLDRPNPLGGHYVDGSMLDRSQTSFIGYINVSYCHGMTIGELARFFNQEYRIRCKLTVIPMKGWTREQTFMETELPWIPLSPHIPEPDTPFYCASTGLLGELGILSIGVGYTLPFKIVGAPWIDGEAFAAALNRQKLPGVVFSPFHFRPFYGKYKGEDCHGVKIHITDYHTYRPLQVQYFLLGSLKNLYPTQVTRLLAQLPQSNRNLFCQAVGNTALLKVIEQEKYIAWKLIGYEKNEREKFLLKRKKYLLANYDLHR